MSVLGNDMLAYAERFASTQATTRFGTVTGYDDVKHVGKVLIDGTTVESGWLPILNLMATDAVTFRIGLVEGSRVFLIPQQNDSLSYQIGGPVHSEKNRPVKAPKTIDGSPQTTKGGEVTLVAKGGAVMRFNDDGSIFFQSPTKIELQAPTINSKGVWNQTGNMNITGDVAITGNESISGNETVGGNVSISGSETVTGDVTAQGDVKAGSISLKTHKHTGVQTGGGSTGNPT